MLKVVASDNPPVHLVLGKDALEILDEKLASLKAEVAEWDDVSRSTDFATEAA